MDLREHLAPGLQHQEDTGADRTKRCELTAKGCRQGMAVLAEAVVTNAARSPGVATEDHRGQRLLGARTLAPVMGIHDSLKQKLASA